MVEGVQVTLPSYDEAVNTCGATSLSSESRVQIVLSEGQHATAPEAGPSRPSSLKQQQSEMAVVHPVPSSSSPSPSSSTWVLEHAGAAAPSYSQRRPSAGSDHHNPSLDSEMDYSDGEAQFKHTSYLPKTPSLLIMVFCLQICHCWRRPEECNSLCTYSRKPALLLTCTGERVTLESLSTQLSTQTRLWVKLWVTQSSSSAHPKGEERRDSHVHTCLHFS